MTSLDDGDCSDFTFQKMGSGWFISGNLPPCFFALSACSWVSNCTVALPFPGMQRTCLILPNLEKCLLRMGPLFKFFGTFFSDKVVDLLTSSSMEELRRGVRLSVARPDEFPAVFRFGSPGSDLSILATITPCGSSSPWSALLF